MKVRIATIEASVGHSRGIKLLMFCTRDLVRFRNIKAFDSVMSLGLLDQDNDVGTLSSTRRIASIRSARL
jgi:hypothetical protein